MVICEVQRNVTEPRSQAEPRGNIFTIWKVEPRNSVTTFTLIVEYPRMKALEVLGHHFWYQSKRVLVYYF